MDSGSNITDVSEQGNSEEQEGLILIVHSPALVNDRII